MPLKTCKTCGETHEADKFPSAGWVKGKQYRRRECMRCYCLYKKPQRERRRNWIKDHKQSLKCAMCGNADFRVLEFHHVGGGKSFNVGDAIRLGAGIERIRREMEKCQCLCANCHRIVTYEQRAVA